VVITLLLAAVNAATTKGIGWEGALSSSTISKNKMMVGVFLATVVMVVLVVVLVLYWYYRGGGGPALATNPLV
jgi:uncharacterized membrane protein YsdA (DUF1294 family)